MRKEAAPFIHLESVQDTEADITVPGRRTSGVFKKVSHSKITHAHNVQAEIAAQAGATAKMMLHPVVCQKFLI